MHWLVSEVLKDPVTRQYTVKRMGMLMRRELEMMCSDKVNSGLEQPVNSRPENFPMGQASG